MSLVAEDLEIEKRENNLIFVGIKKNGSMSDKDVICEGLKLNSSRHVEDMFRVGRFSAEKIRPIRVKVAGVDSKKEILQRAKSLRSGMFDKVFIAPDLTKKQQVVDKDLREHVNPLTAKKKFRNCHLVPNKFFRFSSLVPDKIFLPSFLDTSTFNCHMAHRHVPCFPFSTFNSLSN